MQVSYDLDKIKFATDAPTFERAVDLYEKGKISKFKDTGVTYTAQVLGSQLYDVFISSRHYDQGHCTCYLGQNDTLCKHMVAVAIYAVMGGKPLTVEDKKSVQGPSCSGRIEELRKKELDATKKSITFGTKYIKPYRGPSRTWIAYQDSLVEGCKRLSVIISKLPVSRQTVDLFVSLLLRLDKKLSYGGVDDSDGTVGDFIEEAVEVLKDFARLDSTCIKSFEKLRGRETCFSWEEPLVEILNGQVVKNNQSVLDKA